MTHNPSKFPQTLLKYLKNMSSYNLLEDIWVCAYKKYLPTVFAHVELYYNRTRFV